MEVTKKTIESLHNSFRRRSESAIIEELAKEKNISAKDALKIYYTSEVCKISNNDMEEILYLSPKLLVQMLG